MAISATVNISGSFLDSYASGAITSLKKSHLESAETLTGGKVIVVTGTTDDSGGVTIDPGDTGFRNAAGEEVVLTEVSRILITGDPGVSARFGTNATILQATGGRVAATCCIGAGDKNVKVRAISGTSTYTLLMWQAD
jgi:hypothetical protein